MLLGSPLVEADLRALADRVDVVTFDHEQVDLAIVHTLIDDGVVIRPGLQTLEMAVDKAHMRAVLDHAGVAAPAHAVLQAGSGHPPDATTDALARFGAEHGWPLVLKTARGGYDGKGVWVVDDMAEAAAVLELLSGRLLVEALVPFEAELAVMVARRPSGETVAWPATETTQVGGPATSSTRPPCSGGGWPTSPEPWASWRSSSSGHAGC